MLFDLEIFEISLCHFISNHNHLLSFLIRDRCMPFSFVLISPTIFSGSLYYTYIRISMIE